MKRLVTSAQMRAVDAASGEHGVPASVLMEKAGTALAEEALRRVSAGGRLIVLCGRGNNGGDGLVAARVLAARRRIVLVEILGGADGLEGLPKQNLDALVAAGIKPGPIASIVTTRKGDVVIDAVFGTGLHRAPEGAYADAVRRIAAWRATGATVVSADVPSGLDADTGATFDPCVEADVSLSFGFLKIGQVIEPGRSRAGTSIEVDIGIPEAALGAMTGPAAWLVEEADALARIAPRDPNAHKGTYGHVLVVAGSRGKSGAAAMVALGALRSGAGLVTVATRPDVVPHVLGVAPEIMGVELGADGPLGPSDLNALLEAADGKSALVIGPGIPRGEDTARLLAALVEEISSPTVLDADALNAIASQPKVLRESKAPLVLTPHPGELARLLQTTTAQIQARRVESVRRAAEAFGSVVVLKGAATLIATPDGTVYVNPTGNPGMATAGSGDVLSGVIGALLGQGLWPSDAALAGVYLHGLAGDLAVARTGQQGLIATDLVSGLCEVWTRWRR